MPRSGATVPNRRRPGRTKGSGARRAIRRGGDVRETRGVASVRTSQWRLRRSRVAVRGGKDTTRFATKHQTAPVDSTRRETPPSQSPLFRARAWPAATRRRLASRGLRARRARHHRAPQAPLAVAPLARSAGRARRRPAMARAPETFFHPERRGQARVVAVRRRRQPVRVRGGSLGDAGVRERAALSVVRRRERAVRRERTRRFLRPRRREGGRHERVLTIVSDVPRGVPFAKRLDVRRAEPRAWREPSGADAAAAPAPVPDAVRAHLRGGACCAEIGFQVRSPAAAPGRDGRRGRRARRARAPRRGTRRVFRSPAPLLFSNTKRTLVYRALPGRWSARLRLRNERRQAAKRQTRARRSRRSWRRRRTSSPSPLKKRVRRNARLDATLYPCTRMTCTC